MARWREEQKIVTCGDVGHREPAEKQRTNNNYVAQRIWQNEYGITNCKWEWIQMTRAKHVTDDKANDRWQADDTNKAYD